MFKYFDKTPILVLLSNILSTFCLIWNGFLENLTIEKPIITNIWIFVIYLSFCELWQLMLKFMYHKKKQFTWKIFFIKSIISFIFIVAITLTSNFKIGLLLLIYELYQLLLYRNNMHFLENDYYPLTTGIIKGITFNFIIVTSNIFTCSMNEILAFLISISIWMIISRIEQQLYYVKNKRFILDNSFIFYYSIFFISLFILKISAQLTWLQLIFSFIATLSYFIIIKQHKLQLLQQNVVLYLYGSLIILLTS